MSEQAEECNRAIARANEVMQEARETQRKLVLILETLPLVLRSPAATPLTFLYLPFLWGLAYLIDRWVGWVIRSCEADLKDQRARLEEITAKAGI